MKVNAFINEWNAFNCDLDRKVADLAKTPAIHTAIVLKDEYQNWCKKHPVAAAVMMVPWGTITATILSL